MASVVVCSFTIKTTNELFDSRTAPELRASLPPAKMVKLNGKVNGIYKEISD